MSCPTHIHEKQASAVKTHVSWPFRWTWAWHQQPEQTNDSEGRKVFALRIMATFLCCYVFRYWSGQWASLCDLFVVPSKSILNFNNIQTMCHCYHGCVVFVSMALLKYTFILMCIEIDWPSFGLNWTDSHIQYQNQWQSFSSGIEFMMPSHVAMASRRSCHSTNCEFRMHSLKFPYQSICTQTIRI